MACRKASFDNIEASRTNSKPAMSAHRSAPFDNSSQLNWPLLKEACDSAMPPLEKQAAAEEKSIPLLAIRKMHENAMLVCNTRLQQQAIRSPGP